jgi:hypothetical protein
MPYSIMGHLQPLDSTKLNKIFPTQHRTDMAEEKKRLTIYYIEFAFSQVTEIATTLLHAKHIPSSRETLPVSSTTGAEMLKDLYVLINFNLATIITLI